MNRFERKFHFSFRNCSVKRTLTDMLWKYRQFVENAKQQKKRKKKRTMELQKMVEKLLNLLWKCLVKFFHLMLICMLMWWSQRERERILFIDFKFYFSFNFLFYFCFEEIFEMLFLRFISSTIGKAWNMEFGCLCIQWISSCWIIIICDKICIHHRSQTHCYVNWELYIV